MGKAQQAALGAVIAAAHAIPLSLLVGRTSTGLVLDATGGAGLHKISLTPGTSGVLLGVAAQNNTKTDKTVWEWVIPDWFRTGQKLQVVANGQYGVSSGTTITATLDCEVWKVASDGTHGSDLCTTAAQAITTSAADKTFAVTSTTLKAGDKLMIRLTTAITEAGNTGTATGQINSLRIVRGTGT